MSQRHDSTMTSPELVAEKLKSLSEAQTQMVLAYIDEVSASPHLSAADLMRLPPAHRRAILQAQAVKAEKLYRSDSSLICEEAEPPAPYG